MTVYGLWHGGPNYTHPDRERDLEVFTSITEAAHALRSREDHGYSFAQTFSYLHRSEESTLCPCVQESSITLYGSADSEAEPFLLLERGPRGGVKRTAL